MYLYPRLQFITLLMLFYAFLAAVFVAYRPLVAHTRLKRYISLGRFAVPTDLHT